MACCSSSLEPVADHLADDCRASLVRRHRQQQVCSTLEALGLGICGGRSVEVGSGEKISWMQPSESQRALAAAMSTASALDLTVDDAIVLHDSNKLAVRLLPCDVLARVAPIAHHVAHFDATLPQRLPTPATPLPPLHS